MNNVGVSTSTYTPPQGEQGVKPQQGIYIFGVRGTRYRKNRGYVDKFAVDVVTTFSDEGDSTEVATTETHFKRGVLRLLEGSIQAAISEFTAVINDDNTFAAAYANRGTALNMIDRFEQAIEDFNAALQINPHMIEAFFGRGAAHMQMKRYEQAVVDFTACIKSGSFELEYYMMRALALNELDCYEQSEADIDIALQIKPNSVEATYCKAILRAMTGDYVAAINYLTRTIQLDEKYAPAYLVRGSIRKFLGLENWMDDCNRSNELDCTVRLE